MNIQMDKDPGNVKPDLKHDNMEFSAASDGDDVLDTDDPFYEEEGITSEELAILQEDSTDSQAYALNSAETDKQADADNLPDEDWTDDLPDNDDEEDSKEEKKEHPRH